MRIHSLCYRVVQVLRLNIPLGPHCSPAPHMWIGRGPKTASHKYNLIRRNAKSKYNTYLKSHQYKNSEWLKLKPRNIPANSLRALITEQACNQGASVWLPQSGVMCTKVYPIDPNEVSADPHGFEMQLKAYCVQK